MKNNFDRYILLLIIALLLFFLGDYVLKTFKSENAIAQNTEVKETITNYGYSLSSNDTNIYSDYFSELKNLLNENNFNEEEYAELVAKLFVIDFYTLDNKMNNSDVGGLEFVYSDIVSNFKQKAEDTIYKYIESNIYGKREQELPIVTDVSVESIKNVIYNYDGLTDKNAYEVEVSISYYEDLGYDTSLTLYFVHEDNKLSLVEMG
ncbi:MAG: hypothetical protein PHD02_04345 [Bacilli bacterium]|nr:hypothetical protein [Bacilli bacterium]